METILTILSYSVFLILFVMVFKKIFPRMTIKPVDSETTIFNFNVPAAMHSFDKQTKMQLLKPLLVSRLAQCRFKQDIRNWFLYLVNRKEYYLQLACFSLEVYTQISNDPERARIRNSKVLRNKKGVDWIEEEIAYEMLLEWSDYAIEWIEENTCVIADYLNELEEKL